MAGHRGTLTVNLSALTDNYHTINNKVGGACTVAAVVKADGYGLGASHVAQALHRAGAGQFFVASVEEGVELRKIIPSAVIYVLNGFATDERQLYIQSQLTPVLNSVSDIENYKQLAVEVNRSLAAIIHIDTGMNRLGLEYPEVVFLAKERDALDGLDIQCVMSHFCSSEQPDNPSNQRQHDIFLEYCKVLEVRGRSFKKSLCNSGGVFAHDKYHLDMVRPGVALYGGNPSDFDVNPMSQLVTLDVPILQIKSVKKGDYCGYNETYRFDSDSNIAIVSLGYADGISRHLSNEGSLYYKGYKLPIRGRVSMDLIICDLSDVPECEMPTLGDMVEVIGPHQTIDDLAQSAGTISYEILTSLGARYARSYIQ